ncbi:MAG: nucleotidyltransferase substrate binding protein [Oligoflexia bacterium]|nr:nucleotidyltransferase substrate binding protein [Oligoflexia bacterium]
MNQQKKDNFFKALKSLEDAIAEPVVNQRDVAGIIQNFEFVYELCWKLLKSHLEDEGLKTGSPKNVFSQAFQAGLIDDEDTWLEIIAARNLSVHTYSDSLANALVNDIKTKYIKLFRKIKKSLNSM